MGYLQTFWYPYMYPDIYTNIWQSLQTFTNIWLTNILKSLQTSGYLYTHHWIFTNILQFSYKETARLYKHPGISKNQPQTQQI